eukprot:scaffold183593_cov20-Tisochrysis_lutea.AAC.2
MALWHCGPKELWPYDTVAQKQHGPMALRHKSTVALRHCGLMALRHYGTVAPWQRSTLGEQTHGSKRGSGPSTKTHPQGDQSSIHGKCTTQKTPLTGSRRPACREADNSSHNGSMPRVLPKGEASWLAVDMITTTQQLLPSWLHGA